MERSNCACKACKTACRTMPGYLIPSDLPHFNENDLAASEGARVVKNGQVLDLPTLVPRQRPDGSCVFLDSNGMCSVHANSPFGCRMFDVCATEADEAARQFGLYQIYLSHLDEDRYHELTTRLPKARPRAERLAAFKAALAKLRRRRLRKGKR